MMHTAFAIRAMRCVTVELAAAAQRAGRSSFRSVLLALALLGMRVSAQARSAADAQVIDNYRLTMPVLRRVLPALNGPEARQCPREGQRDPHALGIAEMTRTLEACAPVMASLRRAGVSARDGALVFASLLRTSKEVALHSGKANALAPGALRDNALLLAQNETEIKQLTTSGVRP